MKASRLLLSSALVGVTVALSHPKISGGGCVLLDTKIYCYGGLLGTGEAGSTSSTIMSLDVASSFSVSNASSNWVEVMPTGNLVSVPNAAFSMVAIPSKDCFVVTGGVGYNTGTPLPFQTMSFNVLTNLWTSIYSDKRHQTYLSAMVAGNDDKLYLWGGLSDRLTGATNQSYPSDMRILDFTMKTWSYVPYLDGSIGRVAHSAALSNDGKTIYFLGGMFNSEFVNASYGYRRGAVEMSYLLTFDTTNSSWGSVNTSSSVVPSQRIYHTSERIPGTNKILLYGGADGYVVHVSDYCYTLDLDTLQWERIKISAGDFGPRYSHSMVFVNNTTVFILFGVGTDGFYKSDFGVLDISTWTWVQNFTGLVSSATLPTDGSNNSTNPNNGERPKSNTGAIAGGVVGGVAGVSKHSKL
ncbi:hypothetical protein BX666DRAFT_1919620 [Dichotomocladium elegans]|nr:hypothetical protein BX666DRAFT_1919620 [Dichotomocladium elegans]